MNLSEQGGREEQGCPWQLDVSSFHNQGRRRTSDSLGMNSLPTHTQVDKFTPPFCHISAALPTRWSLLLKGEMQLWQYMSHAVWIRERSVHHTESWCERDSMRKMGSKICLPTPKGNANQQNVVCSARCTEWFRGTGSPKSMSWDNGNYPGTVQPNGLDYTYNLE